MEGVGSTNTYELINPKKKAKKSSYKDSGKLILTSIRSHIEPSFLDYIRGGTQIHFTVAVDFTASNGDPRTPASLHYNQPGVDNQYSLAIKAVGHIVQDYDSGEMCSSFSLVDKFHDGFIFSELFFSLCHTEQNKSYKKEI